MTLTSIKPPHNDTLSTSLDEKKWVALRLFLGYRVFLAALMMIVFFAVGRGPLGTYNHELFSLSIQAYMVISVISLMLALARPAYLQNHAMLAIFFDIGLITLLMHASGGVLSGLGMLIAISIALGSISLSGRVSLLLASMATFAMLSEQVFSQLSHTFATTAYTQAGMLGVSFFALALLSHQLTKRADHSEEIASQRGIDLENLGQLNNFVIQKMQSGLIVIDDEQIVQIMNESAWALLGMPDAMRHHPLEQVSPQLENQYTQWLKSPFSPRKNFRSVPGGRDLSTDFTQLGEHGTLIVIEDSAVLTAQAQQMKLASLGRLTAGIAHEIRNPLGAISHAAQLLQESPDLADADQRMTQIIEQNSQRVNEVVENILKLSRQHTPKPKPLVLAPWLEQQLTDIKENNYLSDEQLQIQVDPPGTTVYADTGQLRQILEVLCDNAILHFDGEATALRLHLLAGITPESGGPFIELHDNGKGISAQDAEQLFEPFFSTRNQGTGLGLYIAQQLSEANRARIEYIPLPAGGSCFRLSFPNPKGTAQPL